MGKPFETPSLFKSALRTFLNRLSYVQFVSGAPIFNSLDGYMPLIVAHCARIDFP